MAVQTKGRLFEDSMHLLNEAGILFSTHGKRKLLSSARNFPLEVLFLRDDDIPQAVADGVADVGIVGENEVLEKKQNARTVKQLGFSKCRLSLAIPKSEEYTSCSYFQGKKIATSYPVILQDWLDKQHLSADIHRIAGSVEIAPGINLADAIFDIVSSGSTLVSNGLKEVEVVVKSEAVLISSPLLAADKQAILEELLFRIEAVQRAEGKKYIMLNVPHEKLETISSILPGMRSPTVTPLAEEGWCSVQSVIDDQSFWNCIGKLKEAGAQNMIVLPIEKMVL